MLITSGSERVKFFNIEIFRISRMVFETLKSDQYLISPYSNAVEPFIKIMRINEMIGNLISFDLQINSPCQYQKRHMEKSRENMDTDVRMQGVNCFSKASGNLCQN